MGEAKEIVLKPIPADEANELVKRVHYSGKVVQNSQIHIGVYYHGKLEGAMQFGPSLDKRKIQGLVSGTGWHEFIELNRMAFSDALPRNSESRALGIAMKLLRKHAPQLKWVVTFADGAQCGDGTIYRAAGFVLTSIKENNQIWQMPDGEITTRMVATDTRRPERKRLLTRVTVSKGKHILETGASSMQPFIDAGAKPIPGYQLRYIYFLDPSYRVRLTVPELPYSEIERRGAGMYKGHKRGAGETDSAPQTNVETGGASPTAPLLLEKLDN
jgi:hypothetical protein